MNYEVFWSTEIDSLTCTVWVLGTVPSNPLKWALPSAPAISSFLLCMCPKVLCWIIKVNRPQISRVLYATLLSSTLSLVLQYSILSLPRPSARWPQLRGSTGLCLGSPPFVHHRLEALSSQYTGVVRGLNLLVFHFSAITVLHYLMSNVL